MPAGSSSLRQYYISISMHLGVQQIVVDEGINGTPSLFEVITFLDMSR